MALSNEANQRGLKDFLQLYNTITGFCFDKCVSNFNDPRTTQKETVCLDVCTDTYIHYNQRLMFNFMDHQERRKKDLENAAIEQAAKEAAAAQSAENIVMATSPDNEIDINQASVNINPVSDSSDNSHAETPPNSQS